MPRKSKPLTRDGEPVQKTRTGLEIPVPTREDFFKGFKRVSRDQKQKPASQSDQEKH